MAESKKGSESFVEDVKLKFGIDLGEGFANVEKIIRNVGGGLLNLSKYYDNLVDVQKAFSESGAKSTSNWIELMAKLSERGKNLTKNFGLMSKATEGLGAASDVLGYSWKELLNKGERWFKLIKATGPVLRAAVGFKILTGFVNIASDAFYKVGQAIADTVIAQEKALEYTAILGKETGKLTHRLVELSEIRVFYQGAKDLSEWGKLWRATTNMLSSGITLFESGVVGVLKWVKSFRSVNAALKDFTSFFNFATKSMLGVATNFGEGLDKAFAPKIFDDATKALSYFKKNLAAWSAETKLSNADIAIPMVSLARATGDASKAVSLLTFTMNAGFKREHVNIREMMGLFRQLGSGIGITTKTLRVLNSEIDTSSPKFLNASNNLKQVLFLMSKGDKESTGRMFKAISENAVAATNMLTQTISNYASASVIDLRKVWTEYDRLTHLTKKDIETKIRIKDIGNQAAELEQRNINTYIGLLQTQINLQKEAGNVQAGSDTLVAAQKVMAAKRRWQRALAADEDNLNKIQVAKAEGYYRASLQQAIAGGRQKVDSYVAYTRNALESLKDVRLSLLGEDPTKANDNISEQKLRVQEQSWSLAKKQLAIEKEIAARSTEATEDRSKKMMVFLQHIKNERDIRMEAMVQYKDMVIDVNNTRIAYFQRTANLEESSMKARIANANIEMSLLTKLHDKSKRNSLEKIRYGKEMIENNMRLMNSAEALISMEKSNLIGLKSPGQLARERASENDAGRVLRDIEANGIATPFSQARIRRSGSAFQGLVQEEAAFKQAEKSQSLRPYVDKLFARYKTGEFKSLGDVGNQVIKDYGNKKKGGELDIIFTLLKEKLHAENVKLLGGINEKREKIQLDILQEQKELADAEKKRQGAIDTQLEELSKLLGKSEHLLTSFQEAQDKPTELNYAVDKIEKWTAELDTTNTSLEALVGKISDLIGEQAKKGKGEDINVIPSDEYLNKRAEEQRNAPMLNDKGELTFSEMDNNLTLLEKVKKKPELLSLVDQQPLIAEAKASGVLSQEQLNKLRTSLLKRQKTWLKDAIDQANAVLLRVGGKGFEQNKFSAVPEAKKILARQEKNNNFVGNSFGQDTLEDVNLDVFGENSYSASYKKNAQNANAERLVKKIKKLNKQVVSMKDILGANDTTIEPMEIDTVPYMPPALKSMGYTPDKSVKPKIEPEKVKEKEENPILTKITEGFEMLGKYLKKGITVKSEPKNVQETKTTPRKSEGYIKIVGAGGKVLMEKGVKPKNKPNYTVDSLGYKVYGEKKPQGYMKIVTAKGKTFEEGNPNTPRFSSDKSKSVESTKKDSQQSAPISKVSDNKFVETALAMLKEIANILKDRLLPTSDSQTMANNEKGDKNGDIDVNVNITEQKSDVSLAKLIAEKIRAKRASLT